MHQEGRKDKPYPNNIKHLIKTHGYTIQEVACETDIPRTTLTDYIVGNRPAPKSCLHKIARVIGCDVEAFHYWPVAEISLPPTRNDTLSQFAQLLPLLGLESQADMTFDPAKRKSILQLLALAEAIVITPAGSEAWERLLIGTPKQSALNTASLDHFERLIGECWKLCDSNELETADAVLSSFITKIVTHAHEDKKAAFLASHGLRLHSVLVHHRLQIPQKIVLCNQSVDYAQLAQDANTLVAALLEFAIAYKYNNQPDKWFKTIQEALYYATQASPLVQSQVYFKSAIAFAHHQRKREAELYIQMAFDVFPDHPDLDPGYLLADSNIYTFSRDAGRAYLEIGQIADAYNAFTTYEQRPASQPIPERLRLEIVNGQAKAAIQEGDLETYIHFLEAGIAGAVSLGSKKRFDEAHATFREDMPATWLGHSDIQRIAEQYHLTHI